MIWESYGKGRSWKEWRGFVENGKEGGYCRRVKGMMTKPGRNERNCVEASRSMISNAGEGVTSGK